MPRNAMDSFTQRGLTVFTPEGKASADFDIVNGGLAEITDEITYNGHETLRFVPSHSVTSGNMTSFFNFDPAAVVDLPFAGGFFFWTIYVRPKDYELWQGDGNQVTFQPAFSAAVDNDTDQVRFNFGGFDRLRPGWNTIVLNPEAGAFGSLNGLTLGRTSTAGNAISTEVGRIQLRHRMTDTAKATADLTYVTAPTGGPNAQRIITAEHGLQDGDAVCWSDGTAAPDDLSLDIPYFVEVDSATAFWLHESRETALARDPAGRAVFGDGDGNCELYEMPIFYLGPVYYGWRHRPVVCLTFDDGPASVYREAFNGENVSESLQDLGWRASMFVTKSLNENGDGNTTASPAQISELKAAGWHIGNHSNDTTNLSEKTYAEARDSLIEARDWIRENGWGDGREAAYPGGALQYDPCPDDRSEWLLNAIKDAGIRYGRGVLGNGKTNKGQLSIMAGLLDDEFLPLQVFSTNFNQTVGWDLTKPDLDEMIRIGCPVICIVLHKIQASPETIDITPAEFDTMIAYLKARWKNGEIDILPFDEACEIAFGRQSRTRTEV